MVSKKVSRQHITIAFEVTQPGLGPGGHGILSYVRVEMHVRYY
jgi:hypothetical protein